MFKQFSNYFISFIILICIFSNIVYFSHFYIHKSDFENNSLSLYFPTNETFFWPTPGYNNITSYFGERISPITGKISKHSGIDIGATEGSYIYSVQSGIITFVGFDGANGYSIHIQNNNYTFIYGHVSPKFIVSQGNSINIGQIIGNIGPKYVETTEYNPYKDNTGKSTNGSTTGPHLHLSIKKDGIAVNPLDLL